jgi:hypothetical protein
MSEEEKKEISYGTKKERMRKTSSRNQEQPANHDGSDSFPGERKYPIPSWNQEELSKLSGSTPFFLKELKSSFGSRAGWEFILRIKGNN